MTTDEINAYNVGGRLQQQGVSLAELVGLDWDEPNQTNRPGDVGARQRLGIPRFSEWAVRGWLDAARAAVK